MRTLLSLVAIAALSLAAPSIARGEDTEDAEITRMAKEHYKLGVDAFKAGRYTDAIKELKKAYLLKHIPALLVNIGKTYDKLNDFDNASYYYKKYLAESPPEAKDRDSITQALDDLQKRKNAPEMGAELPEAPPPSRGGAATDGEQAPPPRAARGKKNEPVAEEPPPEEEAPPPPRKAQRRPVEEAPPETAAEEPPPVRPARSRPVAAVEPEAAPEPAPSAPSTAPAVPMPTEWSHTPIDTAPPNGAVDVRVQTPVMKGVQVYLYYRVPGQADFVSVLMKRHGPEKIGRIPPDAATGKTFQYYIEAKDASGTVVKNAGSAGDPNIVMIDATAPSQVYSEGGAAAPPPEGEEEGGEAKPAVATATPAPVDRPNLDDEAAPLNRKERDEAPPMHVRPTEDKKPSKAVFGPLGVAGLVIAGAGAVLGAVGGGIGFSSSSAAAQMVIYDAGWTNNNMPPQCIFNNPSPPTNLTATSCNNPNDFTWQQQGHQGDLIGTVTVATGSVLVVGGIAMAVIDYLRLHAAPSKPKATTPAKPKKKRPVHREAPTDEAPYEEAPPPEQSSIQNLHITPSFSANSVGLGAGFSF